MADKLPDIPPLPKLIPVAIISTVLVVITVIVMIIVINTNTPEPDASPAAGGATASAVSTSGTPASGTVDAKALFLNGNASTGAVACGSCHTLAAAGSTGQVGPNLDTSLAKADNAAAIAGMITKPNAEIVKGYQPNVMPQNYSTTLTPAQMTALATYVDQSSAHAG
jgi:cytochrome c oxidase subunit 2